MIEALRRSLMRLIGRPATSVTPEIPVTSSMWGQQAVLTPAAIDRVEEAANRVYWSAWEPSLDAGSSFFAVDPAAPNTDRTVFTEVRPGIKPPDEWTWEAWAKEFGHLAVDGWAPCKFAHRAGREPEKAIFVFGVVRGAFGLWQQPFDVCFFDDGEHRISTDTMTIVTHLRSGVGMGIFAEKADATQACYLASELCPWETLDYGSASWMAAIKRTVLAWRDLGIVASTNAHAHDPSTGNGPFPIMGLSAESASVGKPEKLS